MRKFIVYKVILLNCFFLIVAGGCTNDDKPTVLQGIDYEIEEDNEEDEKFELKQKMIENIITEYATQNNINLVDIFLEDVDADEQIEQIGIYSYGEMIDALLVMNLEGDEVFPVEWKNNTDAIYYDKIFLVEMKDSDKKYVYLHILNDSLQSGMAIYELRRNSLHRLFYRYNLQDNMKHYLYDEEDDGRYDYAVSSLEIKDYQGHIIRNIYQWNGEKFLAAETVIIYNNKLRKFMMPEEPIGIVKSYIDANELSLSVSLEEELDMLVFNEEKISINVKTLIETDEERDFLNDHVLSEIFEYTVEEIEPLTNIVDISLNDKHLYGLLEYRNNWQLIDIYSEYEDLLTSIGIEVIEEAVEETTE